MGGPALAGPFLTRDGGAASRDGRRRERAVEGRRGAIRSGLTHERTALRALPYLAALGASWPLLSGGFPRGHDWTFELVRIAEYRAALEGGQLPPFWGGDLYGGYGSPIFLFYAPVYLLLSASLSWLSSVPTAAALVLVGFTLISVWTVQDMMRSAGAEGAPARIAVYVYALSPYLLGDKLIRNANAEFAALCLAPLALSGLLRLRAGDRRAWVRIGLGLGLVIVTHNLTALVAAGLVLLGAAILLPPSASSRTWARLAGGVALALGLAAFFWVPALALGSWMRPEELLAGKFDFHRQFPAAGQLFGYARFFSLGILTPLLLGTGCVVAVLPGGGRQPARRVLLASLAGALGFGFLTTTWSTLLWEKLPFLPLFQFPWRMAGPLVLMTAIAAGLSFLHVMRGRPPAIRALVEIGLLVLCVLDAAPRLGDYRPLTAGDRARLAGGLRPDEIRAGGQAATVRDEYLPSGASPLVWRLQRPVEGPVVSTIPPARVEVLRDRGTRIELEIRADRPSRIRLARWHFPGWVLEIDGKRAEIGRNPFGSIDVRVPRGRSRVSLLLHPPGVRRAACVASLAALAVAAALLLRAPRPGGPVEP